MTDVDSDQIFERFRHLQTLNVEMASMDEIVDPLTAVVIGLPNQTTARQPSTIPHRVKKSHLRLSNLIIMMWERKIHPTRMYIHILTQNFAGHY